MDTHPWFEDKPWIINVQNQKGGTGKSMTAVHLAACLSLNLDKRYRICLIDLDPQGSLRLFLNPQISGAEHDSIYSAVDIMLDNVPEDQDVDLEFLRKSVLLPTQYPNLKTISAFPEDAMCHETLNPPLSGLHMAGSPDTIDQP